MNTQFNTAVPKKYSGVAKVLSSFPPVLDGKIIIPQMKNDGYRNWRQSEWAAFYFEYWAAQNLSSVMTLPGTSYGSAQFDAFLKHDWDLKTHAVANANGKLNGATILNDGAAINASIGKFGVVGFIELFGDAVFDTDGSFKVWHDALKGKLSKYAQSNRANQVRSRKLKTLFTVEGFNIYLIDKNKLSLLDIMNQGKNSNGRPRKFKYSLNHRVVSPDFSILL